MVFLIRLTTRKYTAFSLCLTEIFLENIRKTAKIITTAINPVINSGINQRLKNSNIKYRTSMPTYN